MIPEGAVEAAAQRLIDKFAVSWNEGEYDATAVWGTPMEIARVVLDATAEWPSPECSEDCPKCGAKLGSGCVTPKGNHCRIHYERLTEPTL